MPKVSGRNLSLSLPRRMVCDIMHYATQVPTVPVQRRMQLGPVAVLRRHAQPRPSWCALFIKAFAYIAAVRPELRRAYLSFPTPHLYEHPVSVASVAVERRFGDEDAIFFGHVRYPDRKGLAQIDGHLRYLKEGSIERIAPFRRSLRIGRLPLPLRRLIWWVGLNAWGTKRARCLGTFAVTVYSGLGAASLHPLSPLTTTLNYGPVDDEGNVDVRLIYDHRVLDGATVARALQDMEQVLKCEILAELRYLQAVAAA